VLREIREFVFDKHVVEVAVGMVIGTALAKVVSAVVEDLVMPLVGLLSPGTDWSHWLVHVGTAQIRAGHLLGAIIDFTIVGIVLFLLVTHVIRRIR
jgi:large conductance mechanosensitive channel